MRPVSRAFSSVSVGQKNTRAGRVFSVGVSFGRYSADFSQLSGGYGFRLARAFLILSRGGLSLYVYVYVCMYLYVYMRADICISPSSCVRLPPVILSIEEDTPAS